MGGGYRVISFSRLTLSISAAISLSRVTAEPLVFSPDGVVLVNGLHMGSIQLWDVTTGDKIAALDGHTQKVETLAFSPDRKTLASTGEDGTILLWDWDEILIGSSKSE